MRANKASLILMGFLLTSLVLFLRWYSTSKRKSVSDYVILAQKHIFQHLQQVERQKEMQQKNQTKIAAKKRENDVIRFMREVHAQMSYLNKTLRRLRQWNDYQEYRKKLHFISQPDHKNNPHVLKDEVLLDCNKEYDVIFLVTSFAKHFERRAWIRSSWGLGTTWLNKKNWKVVFNVGSVKHDAAVVTAQLQKEADRHKDLLILDVPEDFHKLSLKVMVALQWVYQKFKFKFILKTDDDIFIHVDRVMHILQHGWSHEHFIGHAMRGQPPERNKGRYGVSLEEWPHKTYDAYCSGGGYLLSQSIIERMIPHFNWETPLKIDDAYIGHLVKKAGGEPLHAPQHFLMWNDHCTYTSTFLVSHPAKTTGCRDFFMSKALLEMGKIKEHKYENETSFHSYQQKMKKKKDEKLAKG